MHFGQAGGFAGRSYVRKSTLGEFNPTHPILSLSLVVVFVLSLLLSFTSAHAAGRVALVLTAEDYQKLPKSSIGTKRGAEIADALKARGFDVIVSPNPSNATARANLRDFAAKTEGADLAFVVLIGHGGLRGGQFSLTTNTEIGRATDLLISRALDHQHRADRRAGADRRSVLLHDVADLRERHRGIGCQASVHQRGPEERRHHILQFGSHSSLAHRRCRREARRRSPSCSSSQAHRSTKQSRLQRTATWGLCSGMSTRSASQSPLPHP